MRVAGIWAESLIDGPGVNFVIYTQGCEHNCPGCHNPSTHDPDGGYELTEDELRKLIIDNPLITGVTFSGGEPVRQLNKVIPLARWARSKGLTTIMYTGYDLQKEEPTGRGGLYTYTFDGRGKAPNVRICSADIRAFDYIIDGQFMLERKTLEAPFRGSDNQRILERVRDF